jgi:signal transduction histidine kinase
VTILPYDDKAGFAGCAAHRSLRALLVEDREADARRIVRHLEKGGYRVESERVSSEAQLSAALRRRWDLVVSGYAARKLDALAALEAVRRHDREVPFLVVSERIGAAAAVAVMKAGAQDVLHKDGLTRLLPAVERELGEAERRRERRRAEESHRDEAEVSAWLARAGRELITVIDVPGIVEKLERLAGDLLRCDRALTYLRDPDGTSFVCAGRQAAEPAEGAEPVAAILLAPLLERLREEVVAGSDLPGIEHLVASGEAEFAVVAALRRGGEIFGLQVSGFRAAASLTARQEQIARGVAQLASLALDNARLIDELDRANRLKSEFVATMSHELRTPLNVIIGYIDLLVGGEFGPMQAEQIDIVGRADRSAHELLDLINATLDLSRLDAGRLPLEVRDVDLRTLFADLAADSERWLQKKPALRLVWGLDPELPIVRCDPVKLKVILKNLIANAIKFTDAGEVSVRASPAEDGVEIAVSDTGEGISEELLASLFSPFPRGASTTARGLGLYIVRRLSEALGGTVSVESAPGRGSTFRITLPEEPPYATNF